MKMKLNSVEDWGEEAIDARVADQGLLMELYKDTGTAKIPAIRTLSVCVLLLLLF